MLAFYTFYSAVCVRFSSWNVKSFYFYRETVKVNFLSSWFVIQDPPCTPPDMNRLLGHFQNRNMNSFWNSVRRRRRTVDGETDCRDSLLTNSMQTSWSVDGETPGVKLTVVTVYWQTRCKLMVGIWRNWLSWQFTEKLDAKYWGVSVKSPINHRM